MYWLNLITGLQRYGHQHMLSREQTLLQTLTTWLYALLAEMYQHMYLNEQVVIV